MPKTKKQKQKEKKKQRRKKTPEQRQRQMENRLLEDKVQQAKNREKMINNCRDPLLAHALRHEFAKLGLF